MEWIWLSFADEETGKFKGVAIIKADEFIEAVKITHAMKINPGGQVRGMKIPRDALIFIKNKHINRLLRKREAQSLADYIDEKISKLLDKGDEI